MKSKNTVMQEIFCELTERNKDIMILVAKSVNIAQENPKRQCVASNQFSELNEGINA